MVQEVHENDINFFSEKSLIRNPHNFGSSLRIAFKFCTIKGAKMYMKNDFNGFLDFNGLLLAWQVNHFGLKWCVFVTLNLP